MALAESPTRIMEHKVTREVDAQRAGVLYEEVAAILGIDVNGGKAKEKRITKRGANGYIVESLHLQYAPKGEGVSVLTVIRPDQYAAVVIPTQSFGMLVKGQTSFVFPNKRVLTHSEESHDMARSALVAALQPGVLQS